MLFTVLASGPSMSQEIADSVRGRCGVIAVSDCWQLAPWADALVSSDANWWKVKEPEFDGPRYTLGTTPLAERYTDAPMGTNSGLLGMHIAVKMGATRIALLGVDLHGSHFFGPHTGPLRNTPPQRTAQFHKQFEYYRPKGVEIFNCNPASKLTCYPMARLEDVLNEGVVEPAAPDRGQDNGLHQGTGVAGLRSPTRGHFRSGIGGRAGELEPDSGRRACG